MGMLSLDFYIYLSIYFIYCFILYVCPSVFCSQIKMYYLLFFIMYTLLTFPLLTTDQ